MARTTQRPLQDRVEHFIASRPLMEPESGVAVGVSGGVDSVVLMHVLQRLGFSPYGIHINYRLRGAASDEDEAFVRRLCAKWDNPLHVETFDTKAMAEDSGLSVQALARRLRYEVFDRVACEQHLRYVAVGHHQNDQAETLLLHLFRGTGLEGLAGMPAGRPLKRHGDLMLVRPLLNESREAIENYARDEGLSWREDATNVEGSYRRNVLRREILPLVRRHFGEDVEARIAHTAGLVRDYLEAGYEERLRGLFEAAGEQQPEGGALLLHELSAMERVWRGRLIVEALRRWLPEAPHSAALADAIDDLRTAQTGRSIRVRGGCIWRERNRLLFLRDQEEETDEGARQLDLGKTLVLGDATLSLELLKEPPATLHPPTPDIAFVDADRLARPLTVRRWQAGDRLQPLGMAGTKKVSDVLTDAKVPTHRRHEVYVVCSGEEIVWVVGHRMAEGFKVRPGSRSIAKITYNCIAS